MTVVNLFWGLIILIGLSLVLQMLEPSPPPPKPQPENPAPVEVPEPPQEEGREVPDISEPVPDPAVLDLASRLARVEDRLNIERRLEVKDAFTLEKRE